VGGDPAHPASAFCHAFSGRRRYGSLATTIVGLLSLEIASIILLFGAQVIAEYERLQYGDTAVSGELKTEVARAEV
jgi:membrane protein